MCFFFNDTATTEIYTLSLHDALPIFRAEQPAELAVVGAPRELYEAAAAVAEAVAALGRAVADAVGVDDVGRSEEHTSELQSRQYLVCRLLLEKKQNVHHRRDVLWPDL